MLTCLSLATLILAQRGAASTETKPKSAQAQVGQGRVGHRRPDPGHGGYFRMNDPGFVARVLQRADTPEGRRAAASVLSPEVIAQRGTALQAYKGYLGDLSTPPRLRSAPVKPKALDPKGPLKVDESIILAPGFSPSDQGVKYLDVGKDCDLGTAVQSDKDVATYDYHGIAPKNALLRIKDAKGTAIDVERVDVLTGVVKDGTPETTSESGTGSEFHVKAGQAYVVHLRMDLHKSGNFHEEIPIKDGARTVTLETRGNVVEPNGGFGCWVETKGFSLAPGTSQKGMLHIKIKGNAPTTVRVSGSGPSGTTVYSTTHSAKA